MPTSPPLAAATRGRPGGGRMRPSRSSPSTPAWGRSPPRSRARVGFPLDFAASAAARAFSTRVRANSTYSADWSMPTYFRPSSAADDRGRAGAVERVEHDVAGVGAGLDDPVQHAIGIWQPCQPSRSLNVPQTRLTFHVSLSGRNNPATRRRRRCLRDVLHRLRKPASRHVRASCGRRNHVSSGSLPLGLARASA